MMKITMKFVNNIRLCKYKKRFGINNYFILTCFISTNNVLQYSTWIMKPLYTFNKLGHVIFVMKNSVFFSRCFGFVARKPASKTDNQCHIFAELEPEQPATAIVNFVSKVMMNSGQGKSNIVWFGKYAWKTKISFTTNIVRTFEIFKLVSQ